MNPHLSKLHDKHAKPFEKPFDENINKTNWIRVFYYIYDEDMIVYVCSILRSHICLANCVSFSGEIIQSKSH